MRFRKFLNIFLFLFLSTAVFLLAGGSGLASAQRLPPDIVPAPVDGPRPGGNQTITTADRLAAAGRAMQQGALNPLMAAPQAGAPLINGAPHYFSHPNYANSPLPTLEGAVIDVGNPLIERTYASDYPVGVGALAPVLVVLPTPLPDGMLQSFQTLNQAAPGSSQFPSAGNLFHAYVLRPTGVANEYMVVFDSGELTVPPLADPAVSEVVTWPVADLAVQVGDVLAFYGQGIPVDVGGGADILSYQAPTSPVQNTLLTIGSLDFPNFSQNRSYSFGAQVLDLSGQNTVLTGGIRKFVDNLAGLGAANANNLGQYVSVAVPDTTTYPGADYYEIAVVEFEEQMHSDLPPTKLRGYVQLSTAVTPGAQVPLFNPDGSQIVMPDGITQAIAVDNPHYLGATIVAESDRPVRIKFYNLLPTGEGGNLFLPVDTSVMGSGMGPLSPMYDPVTKMMMDEPDPQNPMCGNNPKPYACYTENRATLHLHGGISPWISDGTPHQWITPANENTPYPQGVSVQNVPDMNECESPTDGCMTFYYTNQQSARLSFYHDHAWGITRLNVYAGEAAGYLITDTTEQALMAPGGVLEDVGIGIPLVIQDKTFVPSQAQLDLQDETWDTARWGGLGSLWFPHVYSPAQNPGDASGVNEYGRWAYGPWFWPPTNSIANGPMANPYYDPACNPDLGWCEPPLMPGTPYNSMGMESFNDTPTVNGTVYPTLTLDPKPYRFRILSVANDRFFNLSLYKAVDANGQPCDLAVNPNPAPESTGVACTEVALNPAEVLAALTDPTGSFPTPVAGTEGPSWIQIGTEGGFLPAPAIIQPQVTTWVTDPTVFNAGNVDQHALLLGPAERADVIVDFSQYAGQTLILYNDAPAAFPARDPRYDYYTGNPDLRSTGGAPSTLPGYGPNTRTIMQIKIADAPAAPAFDLPALETAFTSTSQGGLGVFENGQNPIIVGQGAYNSAYGTTFQNNGSQAGLVQIFDTNFTFNTLSGNQLTFPLQPKQIQDEMGEAFEQAYGRMSGFMGVETTNPQAGLQNMLLMPYAHPPTEVLDGVEVEGTDFSINVTPIATADDGTQIWKITHNGVDTHPVHWHLYDVQLINRVGWDGIIRKPDANELGWKDTVRVSPLEDTIVAVRPIIPHFPFDIPNSVRVLDPAMPEGAYLANTTAQEAAGLPIFAFAPNGEPIDVINHKVNFGWEYVWHCHILSHEEMDMMRPQVIGVAPKVPSDLGLALNGTTVTLTWLDNSKGETNFVIERATNDTFTADLTTFTVNADVATFDDPLGNVSGTFYYRVQGINVIGDTWDYTDPNLNQGANFPTKTIASAYTASAMVELIAAPTNLTADLASTTQVDLSWIDNANNETGFTVERCTGAGCTNFAPIASVGLDVMAYSDATVVPDTTYTYRVFAFNATTNSPLSNEATITTTVQNPPGIYFSTVGNDAIPGVAAPHDDADLYTWNNTDFGRLFDASAAGLLASADVDGLSIVDATHFYVSFIPDTDLPGLGTVQDEDVAYYADGVWSVFFDGTALGLINAGQDVDAIDVENGILYFSTVGSGNNNPVPGVAAPYDDADIYAWDSATGTFSRVFDASVVGLPANADIDGLSYVGDNNFYLSFNATDTTLFGLGAVQDEDVVVNENGNWSLYFDGTAQGLTNGGHDIDAFDIGVILAPPAAPSNLVALLGTTTQVNLSWTDNATNELGFTLERCAGAGCTGFAPIASVGADVTIYSDTTVVPDTSYTYRVFAFNLDGNSMLSNEATIITTQPQIPGLYFSTVGTNAIPGVAGPFDNANIYTWNGTAFGQAFDASIAGLLANADVDGFAIVDANRFYMSFLVDTTVPGLGTVQDEDVVYYDNGVWSVFFDGTAQGFTTAGQDVDAIDVVNGVLYFSVAGNSTIPGVAGPYDDADIYAWDAGTNTFSRVFDASVVGLPGNADIDGLVYVGVNNFYLSFNATDTILLGIGAIQDEDVVYNNNGNWSVYFDGTALGLTAGGHDLDAFDLP